jgi:ADP-heptose:LPS heptosyltransferase
MSACENILLIRLKSIGDILFTLPAVHVVRENFPQAKIHFLAAREHAPIISGFAGVDKVIPLDRSVYRSDSLRNAASSTFKLLYGLRRGNFSRVIDFHGYGETELLAWWSGAPERWGNVYRPLRGWTYTHISRRTGVMHPVERNLALLCQCGLRMGQIRNEYVLPDAALTEAKVFLDRQRLDVSKPLLFIQPFTSNWQKDWPLENFLSVASHFRSQEIQVLFGGGPGEQSKLKPVQDAGFAVTAGTPLMVSAGLTKLATVVLGADTGLLHFAVAMGRRVVMLMHSNLPGSCHPFQHADWAVIPKVGRAMSGIQVATVIGACERALGEPGDNVSR